MPLPWSVVACRLGPECRGFPVASGIIARPSKHHAWQSGGRCTGRVLSSHPLHSGQVTGYLLQLILSAFGDNKPPQQLKLSAHIWMPPYVKAAHQYLCSDMLRICRREQKIPSGEVQAPEGDLRTQCPQIKSTRTM